MTTPTSNLGLSHIQTEFGGSNPISLSEYYRGGARVASGTATSATDGVAISTSGLIRMGMFRGVTADSAIVVNIVTDRVDLNLWTSVLSPTDFRHYRFVIAAGVYITASSTGYALDVGSGWHASSIIEIVNNGFIIGSPGSGSQNMTTGSVGLPGGNGSPAFRTTRAVTFTNNNTIAGGGGGGGKGGLNVNGTGVGSGAGGDGRGGLLSFAQSGYDGQTSGSRVRGFAGLGGSGPGVAGQPGTDASVSGSGPASGGGGGGGDWGAAGGAGGTGRNNFASSAGGAGGLPGACVVGNSFITWLATGNRYGPIT